MLESVPAVRRIESPRPDLQAFDIVGHVTSADVENLFGLLEAAYALNPQVDVILRIVENQGFDWNEVAADTMEQGKANARDHVRRCAVVGDQYALQAAEGLFLDTKPVEFMTFEPAKEEEAWAWVDGRAA